MQHAKFTGGDTTFEPLSLSSMSRRETLLKERSHQEVHRLVSEVVKKHQFVTLDIDLSNWGYDSKKNELRAVVSGVIFIPRRKPIRWGEPQKIHYDIRSDSRSGSATSVRSLTADLKGTSALKEHVLVRERGYPKHSRM
jgi:hypothetical protein